ncbi:MAG: T9SS type A sorting domain-containing protein [bacterium]|nr:T9SS type A sorting domain-containing protein [bacterium]
MGKLRPALLLSCLLVLVVAIPGAQAQWAPNGVRVTQEAETQREPALVSDGQGGAFLVWRDARGGGAYSLYMQRLSAMGYEVWDVNDLPLSDITSSTGMAFTPKVVNNSPYTFFVSWSDSRPSVSLQGGYIQSVNSSGTSQWTANGLFTEMDSSPWMLADGSGGAFVAGISSGNDLVAQRYDTGGTPLWPGDYVEVLDPASMPGLVSDGAGGIYLGCQYTGFSSDYVFGEHLDGAGIAQWDDHWVSYTGYPTTYDGQLAPDGEGGAYYLWEQEGVLRAQRMDAAGTPLWSVYSAWVVPFSGSADARMIPDGLGGALVLYQPNYADISLVRLAPDGTNTWVTSVCDWVYVQENGRLASDGLGGAFVVWEDSRNSFSTDLDIYAQHIDKDGVAQWTDDGVPISTAILDQEHPQITATGNHSAIIAWDSHVGDFLVDIFAQVIDIDGSIGDPPFEVLRTNPGHNAVHVPRDITIQATFNDDIDPATIVPGNFMVHGSLSGVRTPPSSIRVRTLELNPHFGFTHGEVVTVTLTAGIQSTSGKAIAPLCWSFTIEAEGANGGFLAPTHRSVGTEPIALCPGDFNDDGDMDLVVANYGDNTMQHLEGNGDGGWVRSSALPVGVEPHAVITVDLDRDGSLDAVVANYGGDNVSVLINDGTGRFAKHALYDTGTGPESLCAADFDGDGWLDLATANGESNDISVLINDGTGKFSPDELYSCGGHPYFVSSGDLNDDGHTDLVAANASSDDLAVFLNDGTGDFAPRVGIPAGNYPNSVFPADLDQDGDLDLVVGLGVDDDLVVLFNDGFASFTAPVAYTAGNGPYAGPPVDVDGDEDLDLIACTRLVDDVRVRLNDGTGAFGAETVYALSPFGDAAFAVVAADFDGDGALDLVSANRGSDNISILLSNFSLSGVGDGDVPAVTTLSGNVPNPFNPETKIAYSLKTAGRVRLTVHDARGRLMATLLDERRTAGAGTATWNGRDSHGRRAPSGVYFARLVTDAGKETRKMTLIK